MIIEIQAKTLLSHTAKPDPIFGNKYTFNIYRGCEHQCIYCDSRSECYGIENFNDVLVKVNAVELLRKELSHKRVKGRVGTGAMSDPYTFAERKYNLTGQALEVIAELGFPLLLLTKSDMVLKDLPTLAQINKVQACVGITITTADDELGKKVEPGAPEVSRRLKAISALAKEGIVVGVMLMPVLPFIEDNEDNIRQVITAAGDHGASYVIPWFGMSLRNRQREYYYERLDQLFPGLRSKYERRFGDRYGCEADHAKRLASVYNEYCQKLGLADRLPEVPVMERNIQPALF